MDEPSVLDYLKAKLNPWSDTKIELPRVELANDRAALSEQVIQPAEADQSAQERPGPGVRQQAQTGPRVGWLPWKVLVASGFALSAQRALEPPGSTVGPAIVLYILAAVCLFWAIWKEEIPLDPLPEIKKRRDPLTMRREPFLAGILLSVLAFLTFGGNLFTPLNVTLWLLGLAAFTYALWLPNSDAQPWIERLRDFVKRPNWEVNISRSTILLLAAMVLVAFFRIYELDQVPPEMFSDHAEKLLDVQDVLNGQTKIFFPRNTGREALQIYLTAGVAKYLGTGISFTSLKIGTILAGLLTLPFIYLLGEEMGNRRVGLLAMIFAGIAYWPNVISRVGLRFPLYPLFVAPVLFFSIRGLRTSNRNDFIWAGFALGIGLHGYTPIRILPFVVLVGMVLYLIHQRSRGLRQQAIWYLMVLALIALVIFLPLGRFALENPTIFNYRTMTRIGNLERPLPGPAAQVFIKNLWNALLMFNWDNGETWVHSVVHRPALDVVSAALLFLGVIIIIIRYVKFRNWLDLYFLVAIPLFMLPSILSLAFPSENPSLNRTAGALVPVFVIVGLAIDQMMTGMKSKLNGVWDKQLAYAFALFLLAWSVAQNFDLTFNQYYRQFLQSSWNSSELGQVIRSFSNSVGDPESAWVVAYPHWVDTRLVGINAGYSARDFGIWPENVYETETVSGTKLFLVKPEDINAIAILRENYPSGILKRYTSKVGSKDFLMFLVPSAGTSASP